MTEITLKIDGMTCQHCVMSAKKAVDSVSGVSSSDVSIGSAKVTYDENSADREAIVSAIQNAGYKVFE
ncbi:MAG TPA: copper chaperone [Nitrospirae bacterium]|nr:copper chaperone CopZ [bacterium BMS3Bbin09]HDO26389.1 copper chaperone [Nitrospirota bacterium]